MNASTTRVHRSWKYRVRGRGSSALETLEVAWEEVRKIEPRIPPAVLTLVDVRSRGSVRGYFANSTWKKRKGAAHEIAISPRLIGRAADLLCTMLHEAAHALLFETGERGGIGSTRYYHTKKFRDQCIEFGLSCDFSNSRYGWTLTSWPDSGVPARYAPIIALLRRELPAGTGGCAVRQQQGKGVPPSGHTILVCSCAGGERTIYVKKSVLEAGGVACSFCGQLFKPRKPVE